LGFFDISVLSSASMGPAYSLASTMGPMIAFAGYAAPMALLVVSGVMLCMAIAYSQLSRVAPNAGSSYSWIRMSFGNRIGAYGAWLLLLSNFFATMATAVPAGIYTLALIAPAHAQDPRWSAAVGAIWILVSAVLLYVGIRPTAIVTTFALLIELSVLAVSAIVAGFTPHVHAAYTAHAATHGIGSGVSVSQAIPLTFFGFINAMTLAVWMSDGWELSASTSEEVASARANTHGLRERSGSISGRGGITGLLITTVILMLCMIGYLHLGTLQGFVQNQDDSLAYVGDLLGGNIWRFAIVVTVLLSTSAALWTTILYLSRSVYAMGRDGLLPKALGQLDRRLEPAWSLAVIAVLVMLCELATGFSPSASAQLQLVLNVSSIFLGLLFALSAAACVRHFWRAGGGIPARLVEVVIPLIGAVALLAILLATIAFEQPPLQWYAWGGIALGIPFAFWRARARG
jgi:amino acid transporter